MNNWLQLLNQKRPMPAPMMPPPSAAPMMPPRSPAMPPMAGGLQGLIEKIAGQSEEKKKGPIEQKLESKK